MDGKRLSLATRSDLTIEAQITAPGATWIDRQLLAQEPALSGGGFGAEVREAMDRRVDHLARARPGAAARPAGRSSRAISSTPCAGANWTAPPPSYQRKRASRIGRPPRASTSRASTASASRSPPAGSP